MKLIIDIPEQMYLNAKADMLCGAEVLVNAIKNGIPHENVTEFADRCRECGKMKRCKDCKYFEYDMVNMDVIPWIVAHEFCSKWGGGCKTREDGYCFLFEPKEGSEVQE